MIADETFHAAGIDHDRRAAPSGESSGHKRERRLRHVLECRTTNQTEPMANRVEYFICAGERARMRDRLTFAHFRAAEFNGENRLAFVERLLGDGHEIIRSPNAF